jgi:hypothetical protein
MHRLDSKYIDIHFWNLFFTCSSKDVQINAYVVQWGDLICRLKLCDVTFFYCKLLRMACASIAC